MWFSFVADKTSRDILLKGNTASTKRVDTLVFYSGACDGLHLMNRTFKNDLFPNDSSLFLTERLTIGTTYYLRAARRSTTNTAVFDLCLRAQGDTIYCGGVLDVIPAPACNLICNGNFESYSACPVGVGDMAVAACWNKIQFDPINYPGSYGCDEPDGGTSDYFNANYCQGSTCTPPIHPPSLSVPNNFQGTEPSHNSGQGYAGIATYAQYTLNNGWINSLDWSHNYREYIQQQLSNPLVVGQQYTFTMYVSLADTSAVATYIGALFLTTDVNNTLNAPTNFPYPLYAIPQVESSTIITQKVGWTQITKTFTATTAARWVVIGNFRSDSVPNINVVAPNLYITIENCGLSILKHNTGYYYIDDVSLVPKVIVTVPPATICQGKSGILTASGAATYTWAPPTGLSATTGTSVTASPTITTTYTVTGTSTIGCIGTTTVTVTVNPLPVVSASASPSTISPPQTSQLTAPASAGVAYSWAPTASLSNPTVFNPIASPTATTTYTVTVTDASGCTATATVLITVSTPCNLSQIDYAVTNGQNSSAVFGSNVTITGKNITITGTLNINANITFSGCNIIMNPGSVITGAAISLTTGDLTLNAHTHIYSCTNMWDGIYVPSGRIVTINGDAFIEDAFNAVVSTGGGIFTINTAIFNKNLTAVDVRIFAGSHTGTMINSIVTSRSLPGNTNPLNNKKVSDLKGITYPLTSFAQSILKSPIADRKGYCGISVTDVTTINIGSASAASNLNIFDWIMCGIYLTRSNAIIYNNRFQYLLGYNISQQTTCLPPPATCYSNYYISGIGITAFGTANTGINSVTIGGTLANQPNTFNNTYQAVGVANYQTQKIVGNSITNSNTGPFTPLGTLNYGKYGIYINSPTASNVINITYQTLIKNCENAIYVNRGSNYSLNTANLLISNNTNITADGNGRCTNGIYITDLLNGTLTAPTGWRIDNNIITETANCISLLNVKDGDGPGVGIPYDVNGNSCTVRYNSGTTNTNGIVAKSCNGIIIRVNHTKYNNVGGNAYLSTGNINSYGIYLQKSTNMLVDCNQIDDAARSMVFDNGCLSPYINNNGVIGIWGNIMHRAQDGFVLLNSGIIGTQGTSTYPSNNYWDMSPAGAPYFSRSQTMADNSNANSSILYVTDNNGAIANLTRPTLNGFINNGTPYVWGTYLLASTNPPSFICGPVPAAPIAGGGAERGGADKTVYSAYLKTIAEDTTQLPVYNDASHWQRKKFVFNEAKKDMQLTAANSGLQKFYNNNINANIGKLAQVDDKILQSNYTLANSINKGIVPANAIEQNQQIINDLILRKLIMPKYVYTDVDKKVVSSIANQCPISGGDGVYQARVLLMTIENNVIEFVDNCNEKSSIRSEPQVNITSSYLQTITSSNYKLYPNPNNGNMLLDYTINQGDTGIIKIYDLAGKLICSYPLNANNNQLQINNADLNNGIYIYHITVNNTIVKSDKLVIIK